MKKRKNRQSKALAAANRKTYLGMLVGGSLALALFLIALRAVPTASPDRMVRAQAVHGTAFSPVVKTNLPAPTGATAPLPKAGRAQSTSAALAAEPRPEYLPISFEKLSAFRFEVTDQMLDDKHNAHSASLNTLGQIPEGVKALSDKEVALKGFMLPMKFEHGLTTEFLILRNQSMCCYGIAPRITEWVNVRTAGKGFKPIMDQPVTVCGTFHVGEVRENGDLVGVYSLNCDRLINP